MKVRPILFSAPMVRAILEGRKTQTRRVVNPQPAGEWATPGRTACPYGKPGDRLWVREAFMLVGGGDPGTPIYRANWSEDARRRGLQNIPANEPKGWTPSIHMPRWVSRILLEVTGVRVEPLHDISQADAIAEGGPPSHPSIDAVSREFGYDDFPRSWYAQLWEEINGADSWAANPWVWIVEFQRIQP
jgi:hypothetical protein